MESFEILVGVVGIVAFCAVIGLYWYQGKKRRKAVEELGFDGFYDVFCGVRKIFCPSRYVAFNRRKAQIRMGRLSCPVTFVEVPLRALRDVEWEKTKNKFIFYLDTLSFSTFVLSVEYDEDKNHKLFGFFQALLAIKKQ